MLEVHVTWETSIEQFAQPLSNEETWQGFIICSHETAVTMIHC